MSYPLKGAFFQIANSHSHLYRKAVDALDCLKMKHIIIHTEAYLDEDNEPENRVDETGIRITLESAAELDMKVWIGLVLPYSERQNGNYDWINNKDFMKMFTAQSLDSVDRIWERWGRRYEKFDGFYLTYEGWTPKSHSELGYFENYLVEVSKKCRTKGDNLQIAISPFINQKIDNFADITEEYYKDLLPKTELTTVMLQDGVGGENKVPVGTVPAYMQAMQNACDHAGIEMWANVESLKSGAPTTFASLQDQIAAANEVTDQLVTFEFANYWLKDIGGAKAAELYTAYFDEFIKTPARCRETPD